MSETALSLAELFAAASDALAARRSDPAPEQAARERAAVAELLRTMASAQARYAQLPAESVAATRVLAELILASGAE